MSLAGLYSLLVWFWFFETASYCVAQVDLGTHYIDQGGLKLSELLCNDSLTISQVLSSA